METKSHPKECSQTNQTQDLQLTVETKVKQLLEAKLSAKSLSPSLQEAEDEAALQLLALAKSFGGKDCEYLEGVFAAEFEHREALDHFVAALDGLDAVDSYEIRVQGDADDVINYDTLPPEIRAVVVVYVGEDFIDYGYYEMDDEGEPEDSITLTEVKRRVKVNARGTKRIKMQCNRGYKWDPNMKACVRISGQELATKRKSNRKAVLTKRAMGSSFKKRVIRKTKKAMRYRSALGLKK